MSIERGKKSVAIDKLYELSDDAKRKEWLDNWLNFMHRIGKPVTRIPIMAKQVLDLYELYRLVVAHGGLVEIINKKLWREITKGLNLPNSITSAAFTLRTQYQKYLYDYECEHENLSTLADLQAAIEGNRREGRRTNPSETTIDSPSNTLNCVNGGVSSRNHLLASRPSANDAGDGLPNGTSAMMAAAAAASGFSYPFAPHPMASFFGKGVFNVKDEMMDFGNVMANQQSALMQRQIEFLQKAAMNAIASTANAANNLAMTNFNNAITGSGRNSSNSSFADSDVADGRSSVKKAKLERSAFENSANVVHNTNNSAFENVSKNPSTYLKITDSKTEKGDNSMVVSMEVNGVTYQGVLFPTKLQPNATTATTTPAVNATSKPPPNALNDVADFAHHATTVSGNCNALQANDNTTINNNSINNKNHCDVNDCDQKEETFIFESDNAYPTDMRLNSEIDDITNASTIPAKISSLSEIANAAD